MSERARDPFEFLSKLEGLINMHSLENVSNTPDFILSTFLDDCLNAFNEAVQKRETWYGRDARPSSEGTALSQPAEAEAGNLKDNLAAIVAERDIADAEIRMLTMERDQLRAEIEQVKKERNDWHYVVKECERALRMEGTAESGLMSNLPNVVRDCRGENERLRASVHSLEEMHEQTESRANERGREIYRLCNERDQLRAENERLRGELRKSNSVLKTIATDYDHEEQTHQHQPFKYGGLCRRCIAEEALRETNERTVSE